MANGIELVRSSHNPLVRRCESKRAQSSSEDRNAAYPRSSPGSRKRQTAFLTPHEASWVARPGKLSVVLTLIVKRYRLPT